MKIAIREYRTEDATAASEIWNQVVDDGVAFPQEEDFTAEVGDAFFQRTDLYRNCRKYGDR